MRCFRSSWQSTVCLLHSLKCSTNILTEKSSQLPTYLCKCKSTSKKFPKRVIDDLKKLNKENKILYGPKKKKVSKKRISKKQNTDNSKAGLLSPGYIPVEHSSQDYDYISIDPFYSESDDFRETFENENLKILKNADFCTDCDIEKETPPLLINAKDIYEHLEEPAQNQSTSHACISSIPHQSRERSDILKTLDFILDCPLFFDESYSKSSHLHSYKTLIDKLNLRSLPSVTYILNETLSESAKFLLNRWKEKMIQELGVDGFKKHQQDTFRMGINLHEAIQRYLDGVSLEVLNLHPSNKGHWSSLETVLPLVSNIIKQETFVTHPLLCYTGKFDCIAQFRDTLCLIEWKTSAKQKPLITNTYDNPIQLAAYIGAVNYSRNSYLTNDIKTACIVVAYADGQDSDVHLMDEDMCKKYWRQWCLRLHEYWKNCLITPT